MRDRVEQALEEISDSVSKIVREGERFRESLNTYKGMEVPMEKTEKRANETMNPTHDVRSERLAQIQIELATSSGVEMEQLLAEKLALTREVENTTHALGGDAHAAAAEHAQKMASEKPLRPSNEAKRKAPKSRADELEGELVAARWQEDRDEHVERLRKHIATQWDGDRCKCGLDEQCLSNLIIDLLAGSVSTKQMETVAIHLMNYGTKETSARAMAETLGVPYFEEVLPLKGDDAFRVYTGRSSQPGKHDLAGALAKLLGKVIIPPKVM